MYIIHIQVSHQDITEEFDGHPHDLVNRRFELIWFIVFNVTISNISAISWRPVLVVEEARVPGEPLTMGKSLVNFITCSCESEYLCHKWPWICSVYHNHNPVLIIRLSHVEEEFLILLMHPCSPSIFSEVLVPWSLVQCFVGRCWQFHFRLLITYLVSSHEL